MKTEKIKVYVNTPSNNTTSVWVEVKAFVHSDNLRIVNFKKGRLKWRVYHWPSGKALSPKFRMKKSAKTCCDRLVSSGVDLDCENGNDFLTKNRHFMSIQKLRSLVNVEGQKFRNF